ncbi:hypothetical protein C1H46_028480 [Malus baccata]|uniref:Uncharacterized protein n=1 Tax=Malus baccata TaxID=106549 RepID=A0A540LHK3_MALBA|nr:hypothetical protein C1H46_028480 [Malus baccata]
MKQRGLGGGELVLHNLVEAVIFPNQLAVPPNEASPDHLPQASTLYPASLRAFDSPPPAGHSALT